MRQLFFLSYFLDFLTKRKAAASAAAFGIDGSACLDHSLDHGIMGGAVIVAAILLAGRLAANIAIVGTAVAAAGAAVVVAASAAEATGEQSHSQRQHQHKGDQGTLFHNIYLSLTMIQQVCACALTSIYHPLCFVKPQCAKPIAKKYFGKRKKVLDKILSYVYNDQAPGRLAQLARASA